MSEGTEQSNKKKTNPLIVTIFVVAGGLYLIGNINGWFKSSKNNKDENKTENSSRKSHTESKSTTSSVHEAPEGYKRGGECSDCNGHGSISWNGSDAVCAGCNGKGYRWVKK
ncbi:MAG: hypothetical protein JWO32_1312 [Bacteroidetes bacterium]|nr:hypothetical protein [Bacteroidota bacterium]